MPKEPAQRIQTKYDRLISMLLEQESIAKECESQANDILNVSYKHKYFITVIFLCLNLFIGIREMDSNKLSRSIISKFKKRAKTKY